MGGRRRRIPQTAPPLPLAKEEQKDEKDAQEDLPHFPKEEPPHSWAPPPISAALLLLLLLQQCPEVDLHDSLWGVENPPPGHRQAYPKNPMREKRTEGLGRPQHHRHCRPETDAQPPVARRHSPLVGHCDAQPPGLPTPQRAAPTRKRVDPRTPETTEEAVPLYVWEVKPKMKPLRQKKGTPHFLLPHSPHLAHHYAVRVRLTPPLSRIGGNREAGTPSQLPCSLR